MKQIIKKVILGPIDWFAYTVLTERQRKTIGDIFSDGQKEKVKKILVGKKQEQRQRLKQIKYHLYNLGFIDKALKDLEAYYTTAKDPQLKRLAAWELTLWHANQNTKEGAKAALQFIEAARLGEKDSNQLRRIAIIEAECFAETNELDRAKETIHKMLAIETHADLYLAAANLEDTIEKRLQWINKVMEHYELSPISFGNKREAAIYDDLQTESVKRKVSDGPKVSIILPAFKAEEGIRVAIESILNQTWQNIELLVVDDCSPDHTAEVVQEYVDKDPRVVQLSTPENSGPYVARNIALEQSTGEFVTINDADDWSHAEKIERQVHHLMENEHVIANTSAHARLTEDLKLYRRGTPGKYIFPNMSSIMFRKAPVLEKVGFWDSVRFAADGEFKRRFIHVFGKNSYFDLDSGPLSLPRQTVTSLTASSAFGYNGFFMGVRKEYVESLMYYYKSTDDLRYPFPMLKRPYQVPEPMWPKREEKLNGKRIFQIIIAADFRMIDQEQINVITDIYKQTNKRIGLVQLNQYGVDITKTMNETLRSMLDGERLQNIVFGEKIQTESLLIFQPKGLEFYQRYIPEIDARSVQVLIGQLPSKSYAAFKQYAKHLKQYFQKTGKWYPITESIKETLQEEYKEQLQDIPYQPLVWEKSWIYDEQTN